MTRHWLLWFFVVVDCSVFTNIVHAKVYNWTDGAGVVHFSDAPGPNAKSLHIPIASASIPTLSSSAVATSNFSQVSNFYFKYKSVRIVEPVNNLTIKNSDGYIPVKVDIQPKLKSTDSIQLFLDNKSIGQPQRSDIFILKAVDRGLHQIRVDVLDLAGNAIISDNITVHMMQPRVNMGRKNKNHT